MFKETCEEKIDVKLEKSEVKSEEEILIDENNEDSLLMPKALTDVEEKLLEDRVKEEEAEKAAEQLPNLNNTQITKLDELLTQTQLYSQFLLEKMDNITLVSSLTLFS